MRLDRVCVPFMMQISTFDLIRSVKGQRLLVWRQNVALSVQKAACWPMIICLTVLLFSTGPSKLHCRVSTDTWCLWWCRAAKQQLHSGEPGQLVLCVYQRCHYAHNSSREDKNSFWNRHFKGRKARQCSFKVHVERGKVKVLRLQRVWRTFRQRLCADWHAFCESTCGTLSVCGDEGMQ